MRALLGPVALVALVACDAKEKPATVEPARSPTKQQLTASSFTLEMTAGACRAGAECTLALKLVPTGEFHVNKEYPYKFVATAVPGVTFLGKETPTTFTKAAGDYVEQGEKAGTMTVRFKPDAAGEANVRGIYKLSVCSADQCQIEQQAVDFAVSVR